MFSFLDLAAILLTLSALFGWLNHKFIPLPHTIGLLVMSVVVSLILVGIDIVYPGKHLFDALTGALLQIDFASVVMNGMLGFLLFAGALHVDLGKLRDRAIPVAILAFFGTVISTVVVGGGFYAVAWLIGHPMTLFLGTGLRSADQSHRSRCGNEHAEERQRSARSRSRNAGRVAVQ